MAKDRASALPLTELDKATRARLEHLMGQDPETLTAGDMAFLEARRDYLTADQRADFGVGKGKTKTTTDDDEEGDEYDEMSLTDLKAELKDRGLPVSGKVDELRERLRADDAEPEMDDDEDEE